MVHSCIWDTHGDKSCKIRDGRYSEQIERALPLFCEKIQDLEYMAIKCQALERNLLRIEVSRAERSR